MNRLLVCNVLLFAIAYSCYGQESDMLASGRVVDARTNKGVRANIHYSSIPTGGIYGDFFDSTFSFQIFGTAKYQVIVEAEGYTPKTLILDPKNMNADKVLIGDVRL